MTQRNRSKRLASGCWSLLLIGLGAAAQAGDDSLDEAYQAGRWAETAKGYAAVVEADPASARGWFRLAVARWHLGQRRPAEQAFAQAVKAGVPQNMVDFELARLHASAGDHGAAIGALAAAAAGGYSNAAGLDAEEFANLHADARYAEAAEAIRYNAAPCEQTDEFRQFDFWVGDWEVVDRNDVLQGTNRIARAEQGCVLTEHWTSANGTTGMSMNYYDPQRRQWVQHWISNGLIIDIAGGLEDGSMILNGRSHYIAQGREARFRGTWTPLPDGRVRQFFEESSDDGKTWQPWFEGFYRPVRMGSQ